MHVRAISPKTVGRSTIAAAALVAAAGIFVARHSIERIDGAHRRVGGSHVALRAIERLHGHVNAVTAHRMDVGVVSDHFVDHHDSLLRVTLAGVREARQLAQGNPQQERRLDSVHVVLNELVSTWRELTRRLPTTVDTAAAFNDYNAKVERHFAQIAAVVEHLEREQEALVESRTAVADAATHWAHTVVIASLSFAFVLAALALTPLYRALRTSRRVQKELAVREARYRQLMEGAADAILIVSDGRCVEANAEAARLFGIAREDLVGRSATTLLASAQPHVSEDVVSIALGTTAALECVAVREDGTMTPVDVRAAAFETAIQLIVRDVSAKREVERIKDEFVSVVSHELRTPLTTLRGSIGLLKSGADKLGPAQRDRLLALADSNAERLVRLVNDILDFERFHSGKATMEQSDVDLHVLVTNVIDQLQPIADKAGVHIRAAGGSVVAPVDEFRIVRVLTNLVSNAIKFSPIGGTVDIETGLSGSSAIVRVRDQGRGIPVDQVESIFERFHQVDKSDARQKGGTGLGLAISREIVRLHHGRIWAESVDGEGSTFCFTVPHAGRGAPTVAAAI